MRNHIANDACGHPMRPSFGSAGFKRCDLVRKRVKRLGAAPDDVRGMSRIRRGDSIIFEKEFLSGEDNMSHTFANLEYHHVKYDLFRQPGDVHVHMFGTATLSFADGVETEEGDMFEIEVPDFGIPLRNALAVAAPRKVAARQI